MRTGTKHWVNSSTSEARAMQREEFGQFIHGAFASLKSTIDVIGGALETVGLIFSSDSAKRQAGISRVKEFGGNIWYAVNHPIKTIEALGSQIAYIAETEGISYLMGLGVGELSQVFSGKIVIKGVKNAKATKAADKAADAGKAVKAVKADLGNKLDYLFGKASGNKHNIERSKAMQAELQKIGIYDTPSGREYISNHLNDVLKDSSNISNVETKSYIVKELPGKPVVEYTATTRESFLMGPRGAIMIKSVWDGDRLLTVIVKGGK